MEGLFATIKSQGEIKERTVVSKSTTGSESLTVYRLRDYATQQNNWMVNAKDAVFSHRDLKSGRFTFQYNGEGFVGYSSKPAPYTDDGCQGNILDVMVITREKDEEFAKDEYLKHLSESDERKLQAKETIKSFNTILEQLPGNIIILGRGTVFDGERVMTKYDDIDLHLFAESESFKLIQELFKKLLPEFLEKHKTVCFNSHLSERFGLMPAVRFTTEAEDFIEIGVDLIPKPPIALLGTALKTAELPLYHLLSFVNGTPLICRDSEWLQTLVTESKGVLLRNQGK